MTFQIRVLHLEILGLHRTHLLTPTMSTARSSNIFYPLLSVNCLNQINKKLNTLLSNYTDQNVSCRTGCLKWLSLHDAAGNHAHQALPSAQSHNLSFSLCGPSLYFLSHSLVTHFLHQLVPQLFHASHVRRDLVQGYRLSVWQYVCRQTA